MADEAGKTALTSEAPVDETKTVETTEVKVEEQTPEQKVEAEKVAADAAKLEADLKSEDATVREAAEKLKKEADDKTAAEKAAKEKETPKGAPKDGYTDFTLPEGVTLTDPTEMTEFHGLAKDLNLSQADAQKLVDFEAKRVAAAAKGSQEAWGKIQTDWTSTAKKDPEVGGLKYDENVGAAKEAFNAVGMGPKFFEMLDFTYTGDHPEMIRLGVKLSKVFKDHNIVFGNANGKAPTDGKASAKDMYPNSNMK